MLQQLLSSFHDAYALVREHSIGEHRRQKAIYDEKVRGKPFNLGDLVWLHSPAIPRGQCKTRASRKMTIPSKKAKLQTIQAGYPMQIVSVDIMGPLPETMDGCRYVLVAADHFTRWVEMYAIRNQEAITVSKKLVDKMLCRFLPPEQLHSDQGRLFESDLVAEKCKLLSGNHNHPNDWEHYVRKV